MPQCSIRFAVVVFGRFSGERYGAVMILLLALAIAQAEPASEAASDPSLDPRCPRGDLLSGAPPAPGSVCVGRLTEGYGFASIWPAEAAAVPALDRLLRRDAAGSERWIAAETRRYRREAADSEGEPMRLSYEAGWSVDAIGPTLASIWSARAFYTGGAHGGMEYRVILLDRRRGRQIRLADLFADQSAGLGSVHGSFCTALRAEANDRRGPGGTVPDCPDAATQPISLVAGPDGTIRSMRALLNPYVVGAWAEGPYEFDFAVTPDLIAALKPEYRSAFAVPSGSVGGS